MNNIHYNGVTMPISLAISFFILPNGFADENAITMPSKSIGSELINNAPDYRSVFESLTSQNVVSGYSYINIFETFVTKLIEGSIALDGDFSIIVKDNLESLLLEL